MHSRVGLFTVSAIVAACVLSTGADDVSSQSADVQMQLGNLLFGEGRYVESLNAYRSAVKVAPPDLIGRARTGIVNSALRVAEFDEARTQAQQLMRESPTSPHVLSLYGDALWSSGLF